MSLQFEDGDWLLDKPQFVPAVFLDQAAMECQLPLEEGRVPAGPAPDAATDTSRPLARWQIKVSRLCFLLQPNVSAHPLLIRHMTLDRQHIWCRTDSRQPDVTASSLLYAPAPDPL